MSTLESNIKFWRGYMRWSLDMWYIIMRNVLLENEKENSTCVIPGCDNPATKYYKITKSFGILPYCEDCFNEFVLGNRKNWTEEEIKEFFES